jgi:hypothetical protein
MIDNATSQDCSLGNVVATRSPWPTDWPFTLCNAALDAIARKADMFFDIALESQFA